MKYIVRTLFLACFILSLALCGNSAFLKPAFGGTPTNQISKNENDRLRRGVLVRKVLLNSINWADQHGGEWPVDLPGGGDAKLIYMKPGVLKFQTWNDTALAASTCVMHESMTDNPAGVWVGYADGHLEFAGSAEQLTACKDLGRLVHALPGAIEKEPHREKAEGDLKMLVLDQEGKPVIEAQVGAQAHFLDTPPTADDPRVNFFGEEQTGPATTDDNGVVNLTASRVFGKSSESAKTVDLYVIHEKRGLVALGELEPRDFGKGKMREIRLAPACEVTAKITSLALHESGRNLSRVSVFVCKDPGPPQGFIACASNDGEFRCFLPPGAYIVYAEGTTLTGHTYPLVRHLQINQGQRHLNLQLDLQPNAASEFIGQAAPELRSIKGWKNGQPIKLADLKGKVVLVDFWGYWCGVCNTEMPELMKLHDEFKDKGLVILAVHDDSAESIADMDQKLAEVRKKLWNGRDLPFLIALDGGGLTRIAGTSVWARGATTAAFGVDRFPTTFLIDPDGTIVGNVRGATARIAIEKLLNSKQREHK